VSKIFINYRRDDAAYAASHLHQDLAAYFGSQNVFWDQLSLKGGVRYDPVIAAALDSCKILIALIGPDWMRITEERLLTPDRKDYARWEISTALKRLSPEARPPITIIPLLVGGAEVPPVEDLPDDLKQLFENTVHKLRSSDLKEDPEVPKLRALEWKEDLAALVRLIEGGLETDYRYSLVGGAYAGLVAGTIVGVVYLFHDPDVDGTRIFFTGPFGMLAGVCISLGINKGVARFSKRLNYVPYAKIIGATLGGASGGILACLVAGIASALVSGGPAEPLHIVLAVAFATIFIVLGMLWPDLKSNWWERSATIINLVYVTFSVAVFANLLLAAPLSNLKGMLGEKWTFPLAVLILGAICGIMSGFQAGMALFVYERMRKS